MNDELVVARGQTKGVVDGDGLGFSPVAKGPRTKDPAFCMADWPAGE